MAKFIFTAANSQIDAGSLDLSTGNYYIQMVSISPSQSANTIAEVTTIGTSVALSGLSYNTSRWTFNNIQFPPTTWASPPVGLVIARQNGGIPSSTDQLICYSDASNSLGQILTLSNGTYSVATDFGVDGVIKWSGFYQYQSGAYTTGLLPQGIIFLDGTNNNTLGFSAANLAWQGTSNITIANAFDRSSATTFATFSNLSGSANALRFIFWHDSYRLRIGQLSLLEGSGSGSLAFNFTAGGITFTVSGSNSAIDPNNPASLTDTVGWDGLYSVTGMNAGNGYTAATSGTTTNRIAVNSGNFYKYHRITMQRTSNTSPSIPLTQMEFMGSAILSPTINLT